MITAGIDVGAQTTKIVLLDGKKVLYELLIKGEEAVKSVTRGLEEAALRTNLSNGDIKKKVATGIYRHLLKDIDEDMTDIVCQAKGSIFHFPSARTVIDMGCDGSRAARINENGGIKEAALNEKCASGSGLFLETMANKMLYVKIEDMGEESLKSKNAVEINNMCAVFAESDVITLIHKRIPREDIIRSLHDSVALRVNRMIKTIGLEQDVILTGGVAKNVGVIDSLKRILGVPIYVPERPEMIGALGAALYGQEKLSEKE
jgi:predicted CoA-substrate-specific enzyme activase